MFHRFTVHLFGCKHCLRSLMSEVKGTLNFVMFIMREAQWPHGQCARLQSEWSGFRSWPGTLRCVLGQDTLLPRCLPPPWYINGYQRNAGGNPAMD